MINRELLYRALNELNYEVNFDVRNELISDKDIVCSLLQTLGYSKVLECEEYMINNSIE